MLIDLLAGQDESVALVEADAGRRISFGMLRGEIDQLAGKLAALGCVGVTASG